MARTRDRKETAARRRLVVAGLAAVVAAAVVAVLEVPGPGPTAVPTTTRATTRTGTTAPPRAAPTGPPTSTIPAGQPPFSVGTLSFTVTEPDRAGASRSVTTDVRYPAIEGTGAPGTPATPDRAAGPYPLVVFSGGYAVSPEEYSSLLDAWAAAGYVVADPFYPFTTPSSAGGLDEGDIVHHPGDLSAVITAMVDAGAGTPVDAGSGAVSGPVEVLSGVIDAGRIAAIGHSDGADVTLAATTNTCCQDTRIRAAVVLSGAEEAAFGGTYFAAPTHPPLLVVQGTDDAINPAGCSVQLYDQAPQPKFYLSLLGQSHQGPYLQPGTALATVEQVTTDFLDGELKGSTSDLAALPGTGNVPGSSTLTGTDSVPDDPTAPGSGAVPAGACPGSPAG